MSFETQEAVVAELQQYAANEADLYPQRQSIETSLATKKARGAYKHDLAVKAFGYFVEAGAKKYAKEFGGTWHKMFDVPTRKAVAEELTKSFEAEWKLGNYKHLLPKKYQHNIEGTSVGSAATRSARKAQHSRIKSASSTSKKAKWNVPEGLVVRWAPVNNAWFALWPASAPLNKQQVLKIATTEDMHEWLRSTYGQTYGRAGASRAHSTVASSHARKRSSSQLDREIANVVPSWRRGL